MKKSFHIECFEALQGMNHNKSSGYDGLTVEFYKHFWTQIKTFVVKSLNEGFDNEMMASSQRKGIITLLHEGKNLERDNLSNWRPITLLNVDYKIATRGLAKRLQVIMTYNKIRLVTLRTDAQAKMLD